MKEYRVALQVEELVLGRPKKTVVKKNLRYFLDRQEAREYYEDLKHLFKEDERVLGVSHCGWFWICWGLSCLVLLSWFLGKF